MLAIEFLEAMHIEISELAAAMGVHRNTLSRLVHDKGGLDGSYGNQIGCRAW
jgi:plasmid maintenance system antidote protein VapI